MKKLIITMGIILATMAGFSQVAPTSVYRVADAETVFGINISVGKQVYNIATEELWVATEGVVSTATLTSAASSFKIVNGTGTTNLAEANATETTVDITSSTGTKATLQSATTSRAGLMSKAKFDEVELNNAKETNVSTQLETGTVTGTTVAITSDGDDDDVILVAANTDDAGLMTADQFDKLDAVEAGAQVNYTLITEKFEETSETATTHALAHTAQTGGCTVSLNGTVLDPSDYTLTATTIAINLPVAQYDIVLITYNY
nr:hypothetical protein [uncultured Draconibacterium sp.]